MNVISLKILSQIKLFYHLMLSVYLEEKDEEVEQSSCPDCSSNSAVNSKTLGKLKQQEKMSTGSM